jgi:hypothetical protein
MVKVVGTLLFLGVLFFNAGCDESASRPTTLYQALSSDPSILGIKRIVGEETSELNISFAGRIVIVTGTECSAGDISLSESFLGELLEATKTQQIRSNSAFDADADLVNYISASKSGSAVTPLFGVKTEVGSGHAEYLLDLSSSDWVAKLKAEISDELEAGGCETVDWYIGAE